MRHLDSFKRFSQRADLIHFDEDRVGDAFGNTIGQTSLVRDKQIVTDQLHFIADGVGQSLPAVPIVFGHAVLNRNDWIFTNKIRPVVDHCTCVELLTFASKVINAVLVELGRGGIDGEVHVFAGTIACLFNGFHHKTDGVFG